MDRPAAAPPRTPFRAVSIVAAIIACAAVGWRVWDAWQAPPRPDSALPVQTEAPAAPPSATAAASSQAIAPSFDVVRVSPNGGLVVAGQAEPNSSVTVKRGDTVIAEAQADERGAWVAVPGSRLEPGSGELTLASRNAAGVVRTSDTSAVIVVPEPSSPAPDATPAPATPPLAVLIAPSAPSRLLQAPSSAPAGKLGLDTVDYDDAGAIRFSGTAPPASTVRVYVDNRIAGDATADASGAWRLSPGRPVPPGLHRLRVDEVDGSGRVARRLELPFARETLALAQVAPGKVVVEPGQNLWRLARRVYGTGLRYTVIYAANRDQIRDAKRIYPGQVFAVPGLAH